MCVPGFLELLNSLHPSLSFTMEAEENGKPPFLDALVMRKWIGFQRLFFGNQQPLVCTRGGTVTVTQANGLP